MKKVAVFASGRGSNFEQLCKAEKYGSLPAHIALLIAGKPAIGAIEIAQQFNVAHKVFNKKDFENPADFNTQLLQCLADFEIDYIALAGWMTLVDETVISTYEKRMINIHPALLPFFGGKGMYGKHVHQAVWESGMLVSGATVHIVDPVYDHGAIIMQESTRLTFDDTPQTIADKVLNIEHRIYPEALKLLVEEKIDFSKERFLKRKASV